MKAHEAKAIADERMAKWLAELEGEIEAELALVYEMIRGNVTRTKKPLYEFNYSVRNVELQDLVIKRLEADGYTVSNKFLSTFRISWKVVSK